MKRVYNFSFIIAILIWAFIFWGTEIAIIQAGPPGPPGPVGPKGPKPINPQVPIVVVDNIKDKICFIKTTNTFKRCVNACPELDLESSAPNLEGAECILKCMENFVTSINRCM